MRERSGLSSNGWLVLVLDVALFGAGAWLVYRFTEDSSQTSLWLGVVALLLGGIVASGFVINPPNIAKVVTFFGRYLGTVRRNGLVWTVPLTVRERISLRIQNFDSETLKVNDANGNPVEVAAVIVWRVVDTAQAAFDVEDYEGFVRIQTETAVRHMAAEYPYDAYQEGQHSLRANADEVTHSLHEELQQQLTLAGVEVLRTQLRRLAYAPEIAADMLRRQQAEAVVAARQRIVEGAVGMVDHALEMLSSQGIVVLDEERKAAMVSNLLVVLCSEHHAQPIVNAGTLYQ
ncbi:MAG TPA: SPFH domain-containing protein [Acidimicrobiia bacterium]|jgi:regulator of protease activity HflC (stomatin/prohibitin superfamily)